MEVIIEFISDFFSKAILVYAIFIMLSYIVLGYISYKALKEYLSENRKVDYSNINKSEISPSISLLAPAYNEELNIVDNIKSLLNINYKNYEVIIVNDGSKDNTLKNIVEYFKLTPINIVYETAVETKKIRSIYRSSIEKYKNLIVVDKENGGKADALNAGINVSSNKYITSIDVDCILEEDSLIKMVKPFLQSKIRVIATGGVIRIVNSCEIEDGKIKKINVPKSIIARVQVMEYLRAFLLGRMAWSKLDGLLLISGAFGMFDKEIVIKCGGYDHKTVGEDMELLVRMRRYMIENNLKYQVKFIPDPLCWTEVPENIQILTRQRNRWTRGTIETLITHKKMFFNPKYKILGMLSYPYWFLFEFLAPIIEFIGIVVLIFLAILGDLDWLYYLFLFSMLYAFSVMFSLFALYSEEKTYAQYKKFSDIFKLITTALIEPLVFHPIVLRAAIMGNVDFIEGKKNWGEMSRKGFESKKL